MDRTDRTDDQVQGFRLLAIAFTIALIEALFWGWVNFLPQSIVPAGWAEYWLHPLATFSCMVLVLSLWLRFKLPRFQAQARMMAGLVLALNLFALIEHQLNGQFQTDTRLPNLGLSHHIAHFSFLLQSLLLCWLPRRKLLGEVLAILTGIVASFTVIGHLIGIPLFYGISTSLSTSGVSLLSAVEIILLSLGMLFLLYPSGIIGLYIGNRVSAVLLRKSLLTVFITIPVGAMLICKGARLELYSPLVERGLLVAWPLLVSFFSKILFGFEMQRIEEQQRKIQLKIADLESAKEEDRLKLAAIVNSSPEAILSFDENFNISSCNPGAEKLLGYTRDELIGTSGWKLIPSRDQSEFTAIFNTLLHWKPILNHESQWIKKDGTRIWISSSLCRLQESEGKIKGISWVARDITQRKEQEQQIGILSKATEQTADLVMITNANGVIEYVNQAFERKTGYTKAEAIGQFPNILKSGMHSTLDYQELWDTLASGHPYYKLLINRCKDGRLIYCEKTITPLKNERGQITHFVSTDKDVTDKALLEQEFRLKLTEKATELERSNQELQRFAFVASHDLREPMRTMSLYCQLLRKKFENHPDPDTLQFLDFIVSNSRRLTGLIDSLLRFAQLGQAKNAPTNIKLETLLNRVVSTLACTIKDTQAQVNWDSLPEVNFDELLLEQLLQNLLANALKFRAKGVSPQIQIGAERSGREWVVSIQDNGVGISPKFHKQIFEMFKTVHDSTEYNGAGLGLAICKKIIEMSGGKIWVESQEGKGSTFYFTLPEAKSFERSLSVARG